MPASMMVPSPYYGLAALSKLLFPPAGDVGAALAAAVALMLAVTSFPQFAATVQASK
jgi:hypothetical protein